MCFILNEDSSFNYFLKEIGGSSVGEFQRKSLCFAVCHEAYVGTLIRKESTTLEGLYYSLQWLLICKNKLKKTNNSLICNYSIIHFIFREVYRVFINVIINKTPDLHKKESWKIRRWLNGSNSNKSGACGEYLTL